MRTHLTAVELWNNQFPETNILGLPVSWRMRALAFMASRDKFDVDASHKDIRYALEKLGKSKFGFERTVVSKFKSKRRVGPGNELVDYPRAPCLGADQKARGLWERDCLHSSQNPTPFACAAEQTLLVRFWGADGSRKWAIFTFNLPSHNHISTRLRTVSFFS